MNPILLRPIREQFEHNRVIRLLQFRLRRRYVVAANLGDEHDAIGVRSGTGVVYPDLVLTNTTGARRVHGVVEVETGESVNHLEAMAEWVHFAKVRGAFYLYVPAGATDVARRLCEAYKVSVTEIWSFHQVGEQMRFQMTYRSRRAAAEARRAAARAATSGTGTAKTRTRSGGTAKRQAKRAGKSAKRGSSSARTAKSVRKATKKTATTTRKTAKVAKSARKTAKTVRKTAKTVRKTAKKAAKTAKKTAKTATRVKARAGARRPTETRTSNSTPGSAAGARPSSSGGRSKKPSTRRRVPKRR